MFKPEIFIFMVIIFIFMVILITDGVLGLTATIKVYFFTTINCLMTLGACSGKLGIHRFHILAHSFRP